MPRAAVLGLSLYLALRAALLFTPGYEDDLRAYKRWGVAAATYGIAQVYERSDMDYPPGYAYVLAPLGRVWLGLGDDASRRKGRLDYAWTALAKLPPLAFDLATAALLLRLGRRHAPRTPLLLAAAYLANPAVLFDSGGWGHPDAALGALALGAFVAVGSRPALACGLVALALLTKPLAAPLVPLLAFLVLLQHGLKGVARGAAAAAAVALATFVPFLLAGNARSVLERVAGDIDAMPFTAVNAHNLWGALGPWRAAEAPFLGPVTATQLGLVLFGASLLALLVRATRLSGPGGALLAEQRLALAALGSTAFFLFATHMHENHLFTALPLTAALLHRGRGWRCVYAALSLAVLLNLALHDPRLASAWPLNLGGPTAVPRLSHGRSFFVAELAAVRTATALTVACLLATLAWALGRAPLLAPGGEARDHQASI